MTQIKRIGTRELCSSVQSPSHKKCLIGIGGVCLEIASDNSRFMAHFQLYYGRSLTEGDPDFSVRIHVQDNMGREKIPRSLDDYRRDLPVLSPGPFSLYDHMFSGILDPDANRCDLNVQMAVIASEYLPLFQDFLFRDLHYHVTRTPLKNSPGRSFIVHGCGMVHGGNGYLFLGPSGSGKSTVAALSREPVVLHDEAVLLSEKETGYFIQTTPYPSGIPKLGHAEAPLKAAFFLAHGPTNQIRRLPKAETARRFLQLISRPILMDSVTPVRLTDEILFFSCKTIETVPFFELRFTNQDGSFWEEIERLDRKPC